VPKYRHIGQTLAGEMREGRLKPGQRLPSDEQLMRRFNVSRGTLLRALDVLKNDGVLERVPGRGSFVRQPLAKPATPTGLRVMFVAEAAAGASDTIFGALEHHMALSLRQRHGIELVPRRAGLPLDPFEVRRQLIDEAIRDGVSGLLYLPLEGERGQWQRNIALLKPAIDAQLPIVLLDRDVLPRPNRSGYDVVGTDNRIAGGAVGSRLIQRGCRNLLFVTPRGASPTVDERVDGVRDAIIDAGGGNGVQVRYLSNSDIDDNIRGAV
jgi:LacI family transcriptional regulator